MHEKTLIYGALGLTAIAAAIGIAKVRGGSSEIEIAPVPLIDAKTLSSAEVPVRLTASDGTGLRLVAMRAEAAVEDPLALTELHLTFENPEPRILEGTFRITLPQGASLSRFAMKVNDQWQEGEVVEKQAARQAYEDFLHRKQDPALMEQGAGNEFSARVFPIPARGVKEIIVTYAEAIEVGAPYVLPLRGLPELGSLDVNVHVRGQTAGSTGKTDGAFGLHQQRITPSGDFVVDGKQLARSPGLRSGDLAIARVVPFASSRPEPVGSAIVMVDTSASRGLGLSDQAKALKELLARLPSDTHVKVACFDQEVVAVYDGNARGFGEKDVAAIVARGALGASDFEGALAWATEQAKSAKATRLVLVTDGVATAGETDAQKLRSKVEALRGAGITRMDAIATGGIRDDGFLRTVTRGVLDRDGVVLDGKLGPDALARRLGEATSSGVAVKVEGARWSWPTTLDGLQAGDEILVYAELDGARPMKIDVGGQPFAPDLRNIDRPLVERAWAQAKIQSLVEAPRASAAATKQEIIALSTRHRVLSPYTALLVLENDWDYRRFNIDRNAKVDILAVKDGRVAVTDAPRGREESAREAKQEGRAKGGPRAASNESPSAPGAVAEPAPELAGIPAQPPAPAPAFGSSPGEAESGNQDLRLGGGGGAPTGGARGGLGTLGGGAPAPHDEDGFASARERHDPSAAADQGAPRLAASAAPMPAPTAMPSAVMPSPPPPPSPITRTDEPPRPSARRPAPRPQAPCPPGDPLCTPPSHPIATATAAPSLAEGVVRPGSLTVDHGIGADEVQRVIRASVPAMRACYLSELTRNPRAGGTASLRFRIDKLGEVKEARVSGGPGGTTFEGCVTSVATSLRFPAPGSGDAVFTQTLDFVGGGSDGSPAVAQNVPKALPYEGRFKIVMEALSNGDKDRALSEANHWHAEQPGDVLSLVALGEVFEARNELGSAARAYGSILELFSFRADSRRFAGERLERLKDARALALAVDTYAKAAEQRPDHPASHRLYGFALLRKGDYAKAFDVLNAGANRAYPSGRFRGVDRIMKEDLGLVAAVWMRAEPARSAEIRSKLAAAGGKEETTPSLRFVLNWETDANDVDFHIHDGKGGHAYYSQMQLPSGGELYADVTTGYGPECFTIRGPREKRAYPYTLQAHYFSRGPMGYGMGKLEVVDHDGKGNLSFEERPFVVMIDRAYVDMGTVDKATKLATL